MLVSHTQEAKHVFLKFFLEDTFVSKNCSTRINLGISLKDYHKITNLFRNLVAKQKKKKSVLRKEKDQKFAERQRKAERERYLVSDKKALEKR